VRGGKLSTLRRIYSNRRWHPNQRRRFNLRLDAHPRNGPSHISQYAGPASFDEEGTATYVEPIARIQAGNSAPRACGSNWSVTCQRVCRNPGTKVSESHAHPGPHLLGRRHCSVFGWVEIRKQTQNKKVCRTPPRILNAGVVYAKRLAHRKAPVTGDRRRSRSPDETLRTNARSSNAVEFRSEAIRNSRENGASATQRRRSTLNTAKPSLLPAHSGHFHTPLNNQPLPTQFFFSM
jgi:hypothetical protein